MRYDSARQNTNTQSGPTQVRVPPNQDITYISWRVEGATAPLSVGWRSLAAGNGIIDPMHVADELNRLVLGKKLSAGSLLDIT